MSREEYLAEFDELHLLGEELITRSADEVVRTLEDLFIHAYLLGRRHTCDELDEADWAYFEDLMNSEEEARKMQDAIYKKFDDEDFEDRVRKYVADGDAGRLANVIATEYHRDYNAGGESLAQNYMSLTGKSLLKEWFTMEDDRVRETHDPLDGVRVEIGKDFYTWDNDHAPYPGEFEKAENNVNCRCWVQYVDA
jgi:hypothetical protein